MDWFKAHKPDGTEGTATLKMTYKEGKKEITIPIYGCIVKNDENLKYFTQENRKRGANMEKFNKTQYYFYTCDSEFAEKTSIVKSATNMRLQRFSKPKNKIIKELNYSQQQVIKVQKHVFLPCDCKKFKKSKFLMKHCKRLQVPESWDAVANKNIYGLTVEDGKPKLFSVKREERQSSNLFEVDEGCYEQLEETGPVLLEDKNTVVGRYIKSSIENRVTISVLGDVEGEDSWMTRSAPSEHDESADGKKPPVKSVQGPSSGIPGSAERDRTTKELQKQVKDLENRLKSIPESTNRPNPKTGNGTKTPSPITSNNKPGNSELGQKSKSKGLSSTSDPSSQVLPVPRSTCADFHNSANPITSSTTQSRSSAIFTQSHLSSKDTVDTSVYHSDAPLTVDLTTVPNSSCDSGFASGRSDFPSAQSTRNTPVTTASLPYPTYGGASNASVYMTNPYPSSYGLNTGCVSQPQCDCATLIKSMLEQFIKLQCPFKEVERKFESLVAYHTSSMSTNKKHIEMQTAIERMKNESCSFTSRIEEVKMNLLRCPFHGKAS